MLYIVSDELREIASILDMFNQNMGKSEVSIGRAPVYDSNGDTLGHIDITEAGMYGFIVKGDDDE